MSSFHFNLIEQLPIALKDVLVDGQSSAGVAHRILLKHRQWGSRDRKFFTSRFYGILRHWRWLSQADQKGESIQEPSDFLYRWVAYEKWVHHSDPREFLKTKGFDFPEVKEMPPLSPQLAVSEFLYGKFQERFKDETDSVIQSLDSEAFVYLRANTLKTDALSLHNDLTAQNISTEIVSGDALRLLERKNLEQIRNYRKGEFEIQDLSSQKVAPYCDPKPGQVVVDYCAGSGGKSLHIAALMKNTGRIVATDLSVDRLRRLEDRALRSAASIVEAVEIDRVNKNLKGQADLVLIDAPCSGTGILRRRPEIKFLFKSENLSELRKTQLDILDKASELVKRGGHLVYATCSLLIDEDEGLVNEFVSTHPKFQISGDKLLIDPRIGSDGFFAQKLRLS